MDKEQQQLLIQTGTRGSLEAVDNNTTDAEVEERNRGRFPYVHKTTEEMIKRLQRPLQIPVLLCTLSQI